MCIRDSSRASPHKTGGLHEVERLDLDLLPVRRRCRFVEGLPVGEDVPGPVERYPPAKEPLERLGALIRQKRHKRLFVRRKHLHQA